ncbi:MAG: hypothetical protein ACUX7D_09405 [Candidatus Methanodesulfokora washburnensis]|jgi:uncharacterized membrane protein
MPEFTLDLLLLVLATVLIAIEMILIIRRKREKLATVPRNVRLAASLAGALAAVLTIPITRTFGPIVGPLLMIFLMC